MAIYTVFAEGEKIYFVWAYIPMGIYTVFAEGEKNLDEWAYILFFFFRGQLYYFRRR